MRAHLFVPWAVLVPFNSVDFPMRSPSQPTLLMNRNALRFIKAAGSLVFYAVAVGAIDNIHNDELLPEHTLDHLALNACESDFCLLVSRTVIRMGNNHCAACKCVWVDILFMAPHRYWIEHRSEQIVQIRAFRLPLYEYGSDQCSVIILPLALYSGNYDISHYGPAIVSPHDDDGIDSSFSGCRSAKRNWRKIPRIKNTFGLIGCWMNVI